VKRINYSKEHAKFLARHKHKKMFILSAQIGLLVLFLALWEIFAHFNLINTLIFSSPSRILATISSLYSSGELFYHLGITLYETLLRSIVVICILITIIITIISMLNAFRSCDKDKILLLQSMGANKFQILYKLILPASVPQFIAVLKISIGMSWVGSIMGEYLISSAGLGYLIVYGSQVFKLDLVMASTLLLCILASLMYVIVNYIEKLVIKKRN